MPNNAAFVYRVESRQSIPRELEANQMVDDIAKFLRREQYDPAFSPRPYDHGDRYLDATVMLSRPLNSEHKDQLMGRFPVRIEP